MRNLKIFKSLSHSYGQTRVSLHRTGNSSKKVQEQFKQHYKCLGGSQVDAPPEDPGFVAKVNTPPNLKTSPAGVVKNVLPSSSSDQAPGQEAGPKTEQGIKKIGITPEALKDIRGNILCRNGLNCKKTQGWELSIHS